MSILFPSQMIASLAGALALDAIGEYPARVHPVVWMGNTISFADRRLPRGVPDDPGGPAREFLMGSALALAVPVFFASSARILLRSIRIAPVLFFAASTYILKSSFSLAALKKAAYRIRDDLAENNNGAGHSGVNAARKNLSSLCSRDASDLTEPELIAATVESLAENLSDSFIAPLFYFACFGIPGAVFYRAVNTLDSMIGYHGEYEYFGKASARLDDALNWIPARITALCLLAAGSAPQFDRREGWRILCRDSSLHPSPNAGVPMSAAAGLLRVRLEKRGEPASGKREAGSGKREAGRSRPLGPAPWVPPPECRPLYSLGDPLDPIDVEKIDAAWTLVIRAAAWGTLFVVALLACVPRQARDERGFGGIYR